MKKNRLHTNMCSVHDTLEDQIPQYQKINTSVSFFFTSMYCQCMCNYYVVRQKNPQSNWVHMLHVFACIVCECVQYIQIHTVGVPYVCMFVCLYLHQMCKSLHSMYPVQLECLSLFEAILLLIYTLWHVSCTHFRAGNSHTMPVSLAGSFPCAYLDMQYVPCPHASVPSL